MPCLRGSPALRGAALTVALLTVQVAGAADVPPAVSDRALLLRKWDLDGDGRVDEGEAEVARMKMRREQMELKEKSLFSRTKEKPDAAPLPEREPAGSGLLAPLEPDAEQPRRERTAPAEPKRQELNAAARPAPGQPGTGPGGSARGDGRGSSAASGQRPAAGAAQALPGREGGGPLVTGGARAGGLARPGYGSSVPRGDLNAGRPIPPRPAVQRPPMTGGLLPAPRRGSAPAPAPAAQPRVSSDDLPY